ncbi:hypothetical protein [Bifidobacterium aquikefiri]|uniref:hypothetical protein n=1 Tax=Bifidobacterium aquikefiri TaxID=1653207 RepID=UPI0023F57E0C|nr:hypothetical protein [Bifidobacterium aquikefiri]
MSMRRAKAAALVSAMVLVLGLSLAGCAPGAGAVGDAPQSSSMAHDGIDRSDVLITFIGAETSATTAQDRQILHYLQAKSMKTRYASSQNVTDAQAEAIVAAVANRSTMILLRCNATQNSVGCDFNDRVVAALRSARNDGIPAVLVSSSKQSTTLDERLYAAQFVLHAESDESSAFKDTHADSDVTQLQQSSISLEQASFIVMNNVRHAKTMYVSYE